MLKHNDSQRPEAFTYDVITTTQLAIRTDQRFSDLLTLVHTGDKHAVKSRVYGAVALVCCWETMKCALPDVFFLDAAHGVAFDAAIALGSFSAWKCKGVSVRLLSFMHVCVRDCVYTKCVCCLCVYMFVCGVYMHLCVYVCMCMLMSVKTDLILYNHIVMMHN